MTAPLTPAEIAAIAERERQATPGPWKAVYDGDWQVEEVFDDDDRINPPQIAYQAEVAHENTPNNMRFLAAARTDIPRLLTDNTALRHALVELASAVNALALAQRLQPDGDGTALQARLTAALWAAEDAVGLTLPPGADDPSARATLARLAAVAGPASGVLDYCATCGELAAWCTCPEAPLEGR